MAIEIIAPYEEVYSILQGGAFHTIAISESLPSDEKSLHQFMLKSLYSLELLFPRYRAEQRLIPPNIPWDKEKIYDYLSLLVQNDTLDLYIIETTSREPAIAKEITKPTGKRVECSVSIRVFPDDDCYIITLYSLLYPFPDSYTERIKRLITDCTLGILP